MGFHPKAESGVHSIFFIEHDSKLELEPLKIKGVSINFRKSFTCLVVHWLVFQCDALWLALGQAVAVTVCACSLGLNGREARSATKSGFAMDPNG